MACSTGDGDCCGDTHSHIRPFVLTPGVDLKTVMRVTHTCDFIPGKLHFTGISLNICTPHMPRSLPKENHRAPQSNPWPKLDFLFNRRDKADRAIFDADEFLARHSGENTADAKAAENKPTESAPADSTKGTVNVSSNPTGVDVPVDGDFVGNSPAALKLAPGKHTITVKISGYADWSKEITVQSGSEVQLTANLEK
jgi:hypothetical protein